MNLTYSMSSAERLGLCNEDQHLYISELLDDLLSQQAGKNQKLNHLPPPGYLRPDNLHPQRPHPHPHPHLRQARPPTEPAAASQYEQCLLLTPLRHRGGSSHTGRYERLKIWESQLVRGNRQGEGQAGMKEGNQSQTKKHTLSLAVGVHQLTNNVNTTLSCVHSPPPAHSL